MSGQVQPTTVKPITVLPPSNNPPKYIPASRFYSPIEPAYQTCGDVSIIPMALGPISRVLGKCAQTRPGTGQCWGAFLSHQVDARDTPAQCLYEENSVVAAHFGSGPDPGDGLYSYQGENMFKKEAQQTATPCEKWGPCASFGSYSACSNCSLSSGVGNTVLGQSATPWCLTNIKYSKPFPKDKHQPSGN